MSDYLDPSRYEPAIGPIEEEFCGKLDTFQVDVESLSFYDHCGAMETKGIEEHARLRQQVPAAHDELVQFVADLETKLAAANAQLEHIYVVAVSDETMQKRLSAIESSFNRAAPSEPGSLP